MAFLSDYEIIVGGYSDAPNSIYYGGLNREGSISLRRVEGGFG